LGFHTRDFGVALFYTIGALRVVNIAWAIPLTFGLASLTFLKIRNIIKLPLVDSTRQVENLAKGNLIMIIENHRKGKYELELLANSINALSSQLNSLISEIQKGAG
jgi:methyl-accepting chemotaxis protein